MSDGGCVFCKIVAGELPCRRVYEDDEVLSFLDIAPIAKGHTLVIPKRHCEIFSELPPEDAAAVGRALAVVAPAVKAAVGAEGYNLLLAEGASAGQVVPHVHFHIIPRRGGDGLGFGWKHGSCPAEEMERIRAAVADRIG